VIVSGKDAISGPSRCFGYAVHGADSRIHKRRCDFFPITNHNIACESEFSIVGRLEVVLHSEKKPTGLIFMIRADAGVATLKRCRPLVQLKSVSPATIILSIRALYWPGLDPFVS
jgi:hypothetical protein